MRAVDSTTPSAIGVAPPDRPVPAPRGTTATASSRQMLRMATTCASLSGSVTIIGSWRYTARPSHSYGRVSSGSDNTQRAGSTASKAAATRCRRAASSSGSGMAAFMVKSTRWRGQDTIKAQTATPDIALLRSAVQRPIFVADFAPRFPGLAPPAPCFIAFRWPLVAAMGIVHPSQPHKESETIMLQQIISHTPLYVWALLAFLMYRGYLASKDREATLRNLAIIPGVMLVLSIQGILGKFGGSDVALVAWAAGAIVSTAVTWSLIDASRITAHRGKGTLHLRGSWVSLMLMMAIFVVKYSVAIVSAMHPALSESSTFMLAICGLFGLCNGIFFGRLLRCVSVYLQQPAAMNA